MKVELAKTAGFCFGVKRAVDTVYEQVKLHPEEPIYTYGPIIHNEEVVRDLEQKGVRVIYSEEELKELERGIVIIRSHGVAKKVYDCLERRGLTCVDATCPFVKKIHHIVEEYSEQGYGIIIIGSADHPEVQAISGWCKEPPVIIESEEEARNFKTDPDKKLCLVSQTTFNYNKFQLLVEIISKKGYDIRCLNTICNATEERQSEAREIAGRVDAMIVIGGRQSSNTQKLYDICKNECKNTYYNLWSYLCCRRYFTN
mgnify:FL=1